MTHPEALLSRLKRLAVDTIEDCTFVKSACYRGTEEPMRLLLPSGDEKYLSFWVRDAAMMAECGLVPNDDLRRYVEIVALCGQNGADERRLANGLSVPPGAVADHINYDGRPVFFPGTYCTGEDQGRGEYGYLPPFCDNYYFILMATQYVAQSGDTAILAESFGDTTLAERLRLAFGGYGIDPESGLCVSAEERYTVDWGFTDTVKKTGKLLMASLLRRSAALALSRLWEKEEAERYRTEADRIKKSILTTFFDERTGWLLSATGIGRQPDVFATAYAVYSGVTEEAQTLEALFRGYRDGTTVKHGYVRPIPTDCNATDTSAWECARTELDTYQNGGYWATPTGWYAYALYLHHGGTEILEDFLSHTERYAEGGAPFEWIDAETRRLSGLHYGTSGTMPYAGALRLFGGT